MMIALHIILSLAISSPAEGLAKNVLARLAEIDAWFATIWEKIYQRRKKTRGTWYIDTEFAWWLLVHDALITGGGITLNHVDLDIALPVLAGERRAATLTPSR
jgi:hypothetical protein